VTGFCRLIVLAVLAPLAPDGQGLIGAALPSYPSARGRSVPVCEFDSLGDGMAMALMGLYDLDLRIVLYSR
jgi:hypothetical protein